ncbi:MAG: hypothetical protein K2Y39_06735 [Candidatus Obscuribacterales bacterium]|nr:hypothetical protein [Candidatus Obscuribacterales bacterium]
MLEGLLVALACIAGFFLLCGVMWACFAFLGFLIELIMLPFSLTGLIVSVIQQKRGMGENGKSIAIRALIVGITGAVAFAAVAFFMGASLAHIGIAALAGLLLGAMFGL